MCEKGNTFCILGSLGKAIEKLKWKFWVTRCNKMGLKGELEQLVWSLLFRENQLLPELLLLASSIVWFILESSNGAESVSVVIQKTWSWYWKVVLPVILSTPRWMTTEIYIWKAFRKHKSALLASYSVSLVLLSLVPCNYSKTGIFLSLW